MSIKCIENKLIELAEEIKELEEAEEACQYALHYIAEVEQFLPNGIGMSHHAEMEMDEVLCEIQDRLQELADKIGEI